jgi:hypothetical protein
MRVRAAISANRSEWRKSAIFEAEFFRKKQAVKNGLKSGYATSATLSVATRLESVVQKRPATSGRCWG